METKDISKYPQLEEIIRILSEKISAIKDIEWIKGEFRGGDYDNYPCLLCKFSNRDIEVLMVFDIFTKDQNNLRGRMLRFTLEGQDYFFVGQSLLESNEILRKLGQKLGDIYKALVEQEKQEKIEAAKKQESFRIELEGRKLFEALKKLP